MSNNKSPSQLIEERMSEMPDMMYNGEEPEYKYVCMDTGMTFETYGESASVSPFTGTSNIMMREEVAEQTPADFQQMKDIPSSQKDPMKQTPVSQNPAPAQPGSGSWTNQPWSPNPASDQQGVVGADSAGPRGFVPYPQQSMQPGQVPPHVNKQPGERTDK